MSNEEKKVCLTKAEILNANDLPIKEMIVKEWGGTIFLKGFDGVARDSFEKAVTKNKEGIDGIMSLLVSMSIVDDKGDRLFNEKDVELLNKKNGTVLARIFKEIKELNGIGDAVVDTLAKN